MRIAIAIATTGRSAIVAECVRRLSRQTRPADRALACGAAPEDTASLTAMKDIEAVTCAHKGSTFQRNELIDAIGESADLIVFMDDDFVLHETYLARLEQLFASEPQLVAVNGVATADGINTDAGYSFAEADAILADTSPPDISRASRAWIEGVYGCNFAVRVSAVRAHNIRFDERLPLYGWQEDIDFAAQLSRHGKVLRTNALTGVHLGVKGGRVSGLRFGYSQMANPVYLGRKGTMRWSYALKLMAKNFAANLWGAIAANKVIDRRGRLKGNMMALQDILFRRKVRPEREFLEL